MPIHNRYEGMAFPEYVYHEFPKAIYDGQGKLLGTAQDEREEAVLTAGKPVYRENEDRQRLQSECFERGLRFDPAWGADRLRAFLKANNAPADATAGGPEQEASDDPGDDAPAYDIESLRTMAKAQGVKGSHLMGEDRLKKELGL